MLKPRVFIGSSSESVRVANALQENLELNSKTECIVWNQGIFELSKSTLDNLIETIHEFDFAVFVFSGDDIVNMRKEKYLVARDNVVFETGLSIGILGKDRTFFVKPKGSEEFHLPTDLLGITFPEFDQNRFDKGDEISSLSVASNKILRAIDKTHKPEDKKPQELNAKDLASIFDQTGLTYAYQSRLEAHPKMLEDIRNANHSIVMYARVYLSDLLKSPDFAEAITKTVASKKASDSTFLVKHISSDPEDKDLVNQLYAFEDPEKRRWKSLESYVNHVKESDSLFDERYEDISSKLASIKNAERAKVSFERHYITKYLLPYSLLIIDESIVFVSFYSMSTNRYGTFAPTMRLVFHSGDPERRWAFKFLQEKDTIDKIFVKTGYLKPII